jgi:tetratricopeptide (TPR) repeat protein
MDNALQEGFYRDPWARKIQSNYWFMEGERHRAAGRQEEAIAAYERAAELAFDSRTARYNVALMLFRYNKLDQAMAHVQAAWRLDPWQRAPQQLMALIRQQQEQMQEPGSLLKGAEVTDGFP